MSRNTVIKAESEVIAGIDPSDRLRVAGGGDKPLIDKQPGLLDALDELVHPETRGNPMSLLRWTSKSSRPTTRCCGSLMQLRASSPASMPKQPADRTSGATASNPGRPPPTASDRSPENRQPGLQPNGCPPRLPLRGIAPCPTSIDQNAPRSEQILPLRRLDQAEGKRTYENTTENIDLVLKGQHRSPSVTPSRSTTQQLRRSRPLSVTR